MFNKLSSSILLALTLSTCLFSCHKPMLQQTLDTKLIWDELPELPDKLGTSGAFVGFHNNTVVIACGSNFKEPYFEQKNKEYLSTIYLLKKETKERKKELKWIKSDVDFPMPLAYGVSISLDDGILCIGGHNNDGATNKVFQLKVEFENGIPYPVVKEKEELKLPIPLTQASGISTSANSQQARLYILCGSTSEAIETAQPLMFYCNYATTQKGKVNWQVQLSKEGTSKKADKLLPFAPRIFAPIAYQYDGTQWALYIFSGRKAASVKNENSPYGLELLQDAWKFIPDTSEWKKLAPTPECLMAGSAYSWGLNHIFFLNGTNGETLKLQEAGIIDPQKNHPGFDKRGWCYHTLTDSYNPIELPVNQLTTPPARLGTSAFSPMLVLSGEIAPRVRSTKNYQVIVDKENKTFGTLNYTILLLYLITLLAVGIFFYFRNKTVSDFFKGGGRIPFWVAGFSIFATMLSSITFIAIPAKVYATNWCNYLLNLPLLIITPFIITFFLPFFREIKSASAYEYLEKRFNKSCRYFASLTFIIYHVIRMGIVIYLPALAINEIIQLHINPQINMLYSILIMAGLSIIYCSLGGLEAVVWTDTIQSFILLGGAFLTVALIIIRVGGIAEFFQTAMEYKKFKIAVFDFSLNSFKHPVLWVIILGGFGQNLIPYASDQSIIQRYMAVKEIGEAKKSIWTNTILSLFASALFFLVGTALFVFYKNYSHALNPSISKVDEIFPTFIVKELPVGISGLLVASILAAAQSTISTSINSATAIIISDFLLPFTPSLSEKKQLILSRIITIIFGLLGTGCAIILLSLNNPSLWDSFMDMLGLVLGAICGLFLLGVFFQKANGLGAMVGVILGICTTLLLRSVGLHGYLNGFINFFATMLWGLIASMAIKGCGVQTEFLPNSKQDNTIIKKLFLCEEGNSFKYSYRKKIKN